MVVFLYEFITGGGLWQGPEPGIDDHSLLAQGRAMVQAIAGDFCELPGIEVWTTRDLRLPPLHPAASRVTTVASQSAGAQAIQELTAAADWTLLIAPETDNCLANISEAVVAAGGRLFSPSPAVIALTTDKHATAGLLERHGIPVPRGLVLPEDCRVPERSEMLVDTIGFPAILKPNDDCGSAGLHLVRTAADWPSAPLDEAHRCEEFVPGLAASVAVLCGPAGNYSLPACKQRLTTNGRFQYLGGRLPLASALDRRARSLAERAIAVLPGPVGYLGVDLVLGPEADGSSDRVIEINPRLTTSYVGLRAASQTNLAAAMLAVAQGHPPNLSFHSAPVEFSANGLVGPAVPPAPPDS